MLIVSVCVYVVVEIEALAAGVPVVVFFLISSVQEQVALVFENDTFDNVAVAGTTE